MRIAMVAGEASGDLLAGHLMRALRARFPHAVFEGIGGPKMLREGFDAWWPSERLAVYGYVDALRRYRELSGIRKNLLKRLLAHPPDIFIGVDAPDFNLWLEKKLRRAGVRTVHYVSPSIWAWRGRRVFKIRDAADMVLCLFPFEPELYRKHGGQAEFVGHPLADVFPLEPDREATRETLQLDLNKTIIAFLPGSRQGEVSRLADDFIAAARLLHERRPELQFLVPLVTRETRTLFENALFRAEVGDLPMTLMFGHADQAMAAADVVVVASGTATLEAALLKRPMVVAYRVANLSYRIMKRLAYLPYVSLPNILAKEALVPEFVQHALTPVALADAVEAWLDDKPRCEALVARFRSIHLSLRQNHAERAASAILSVLGRSR